MAKEFSRTTRIAGQIQRELAILIQREVRDPRVGMVSVSAVEVSRDLAHAKVYVTTADTERDVAEIVAVLNKAAGFLRHTLGQRMLLRVVPALHFFYDTSIERGARLTHLIDTVTAGRSETEKKEDE